jgi:DNA-binding MarR family transcriptional regulator
MSAPAPKVPLLSDDAAFARRAVHPVDAPSVHAVGAVLQRGRMTAKDLRLASGLPRRTIYRALSILCEEGLVQQRRSLQDSRQSYFWLVAAGRPPASNLHLDDLAAGEAADDPATSVP